LSHERSAPDWGAAYTARVATARGTQLRQVQERELIVATRALFDERGMQDAPVEEIARSVGIARGLIYRSFASKEELYVLTVTDYLDELSGELAAATAGARDPVDRARRCIQSYASFCGRYPAFLDCSLSLMQGPAADLRVKVSDSVWLRLGQGRARCLHHVAETLRLGEAAGVFAIDDPDLMANVLWTQTLGAMHLARIGVGVGRADSGLPHLFPVSDETVVEVCVRSALATVGVAPEGRGG
jgi:AcrR family transcriptional regulator